MKKFNIFPVFLAMFDGGAASGAGGVSAAGTGTGDTTGGSASTQQSDTGAKVVLGKPPKADTSKEEPSTAKGNTQPPAAGEGEDRSAQFKAMIQGDYKDLYDAEVQRIINRRFAETKSLQDSLAAQAPIIEQLSQKYGIDGSDLNALRAAIEDDDALWAAQAEEAGMSVEQYKQVQKIEQENKQLRKNQEDQLARQRSQQQVQTWLQQAEVMKADERFKDFDLQKEISENPEFLNLLKVGIPVDHAYSVLHLNDITQSAAQKAAQEAEKAVTANIRARGNRPAENSASSQAATIYKSDPSKWTDAEFAEAIRRSKRGEKILL